MIWIISASTHSATLEHYKASCSFVSTGVSQAINDSRLVSSEQREQKSRPATPDPLSVDVKTKRCGS
jgi:hypothetical protein